MSAFLLVHGAGGSAWSWHCVVAELARRGHDAVAVDLPCDDDSAGLAEYADAAVAAAGDRTGLTVLAHSLGAFTAPLLCDRVPVDLMVLVAAMVPAPGEPPGEWWENRDQSGTPFEAPWPLERWPDVPTRFLLCREDRFFPAAFLRRVVPERLGFAPDDGRRPSADAGPAGRTGRPA